LKNKILHTFYLCLTLVNLSAQIKLLDLKKANCQLFKGQLYAFGLMSTKTTHVFSIYKFNSQFSITDSLQIEISKKPNETYLQLYSDTLHHFLNIYLQKENQNTVQVLRFDPQINLLCSLPSIDVARLNNISLFDSDVLYFNDEVYSVKIIRDSSGKQFYINKFKLVSNEKNFDYEMNWQFPFERKNVEHAHLIYINKKHVYVYVNVSQGIKKGQWLLKLNALNGQLIKASKLNDKGETNTYLFGNHYFDAGNQSLHLIGIQLSEAQYNFEKNSLKLDDLAFTSIYHLELDSLGDIQDKQIFKIPIVSITSGAKKISSATLLKINTINKSADGKLVFEGDVFKSTGGSKCFFYVNSIPFSLSYTETGFVMDKNTITTNKMIEDYYFVKDRLDLNGRMCADSLSQFTKLMYQNPSMPIKIAFKTDAENNALYLLNKHSFNKNNVNYSVLSPVKKIYQITSIEDISENKFPAILLLSKEQYVIIHQIEEQKFQLKLYTW